jgi:hypothetical protein
MLAGAYNWARQTTTKAAITKDLYFMCFPLFEQPEIS